MEEAEDDNFVRLELACKAKPRIKLSRSSGGTLIKVICIELHFAARCNLQVAVCPQNVSIPGGGEAHKMDKCHCEYRDTMFDTALVNVALLWKKAFVHAGAPLCMVFFLLLLLFFLFLFLFSHFGHI